MFGNVQYGAGGISFYDQYTASFVGIIILNVALFNVGPGLVIYKEMGVFKSLAFTPLKTSVILEATVLRCFVIFLIGVLEIFLIGFLMFDRVPTVHAGQFALAVVLAAYALFAFGFMVSCFVNSAGSSYGASIVLFQFMMLLSGASFPITQFPPYVQEICKFVPMTYVVELLRMSWEGALFTQAALTPTLILALFGVLSHIIAARKFQWYLK